MQYRKLATKCSPILGQDCAEERLDVVVFRSEVWHRGTANTSNRTRYLLQVHYGMRMITQKYPPYLNRFQFDPTILETATERQRRLMGDHQRSNYD